MYINADRIAKETPYTLKAITVNYEPANSPENNSPVEVLALLVKLKPKNPKDQALIIEFKLPTLIDKENPYYFEQHIINKAQSFHN